ncbi:hypothetical protein [Streptomyces sp. NBC_01615]|uniref:hypothetical protein n=1 Tax=Streptomyces sp. NBC_01615 TaxID=2975898 RepID=UPI00386C296F
MRQGRAADPCRLPACRRRTAAPLIVTALAENYSPAAGGWFMSAMALLSLACVLALPETRDRDLDHV